MAIVGLKGLVMSSETNFSWSGPKISLGEKWTATSKRLRSTDLKHVESYPHKQAFLEFAFRTRLFPLPSCTHLPKFQFLQETGYLR